MAVLWSHVNIAWKLKSESKKVNNQNSWSSSSGSSRTTVWNQNNWKINDNKINIKYFFFIRVMLIKWRKQNKTKQANAQLVKSIRKSMPTLVPNAIFSHFLRTLWNSKFSLTKKNVIIIIIVVSEQLRLTPWQH